MKLEEIWKNKKDIELSARKKFQELSEDKKKVFSELMENTDVGLVQVFLRKNGFSPSEAARFYMFIDELNDE